ncbi:MAG TPA: sulfotransferase [Candidatus Acidoferrales bacterium]|jgi:tetratricopeptide (TPR) repeat protein|nr:sulfotransferase [Candidatus Acidoferrales bacterium]
MDLQVALDQALAAEAAQPAVPEAYARAGAILAVMGKPLEALVHLDRAIALNPGMPEALNNRGAVLRGLGRLEEAFACFERALAAAPEYADARYNLAGTLVKLERFDEAMPHYERLLEVRADSAEIHGAYGKLLWKAGRTDEAIEAFTRSISFDPSYADVRAEYASALAQAGRIDEAVTTLERAIELAPRRPEFYHSLAETKRSRLTSAHVATLEAMLREGGLSDDELISVHFALGKAYESDADRARSFRHYLSANAAKRRCTTYDERDTVESFARIAETFTPAFFDARRGCSVDSRLPIFIFGMPRSGTTLIEQILVSHPDVAAGGELSELEDAVNAVLASDGPIRPDTMLAASCDRLREIAQRYLSALARLAPAATNITDKMPANVRLAGLIHTILPNARMIHARRNPVDNCLSIFSLHFAGEMSWAYNLEELGRYYRAYERLAAHWRTVLPPGAMLEVQYEDVVDDLETQARRIVAFCGLEWNPACLEFYKTKRHVKTASVTQVRQPIYRTSVNRAEGYGDLIKPLIDALG